VKLTVYINIVTVYELLRGQKFSTKFTNYFDYCAHYLQIIHKTYHLNEFTDSVLKFCTNIIQNIKRDSKELMHKNEGFIYNYYKQIIFNNNFVLLLITEYFYNRYNRCYEQLAHLGAGSFGSVYKVRDKYNKQIRAIKIITIPGLT